MNFHNIELFEKKVLNEIENILLGKIEGTIYKKSEMTNIERAFINGIIRKTKPKVIVELGVSAGGSSCVILNAIKDIDDARLYSFDYNSTWYREVNQDNGRKTGFLVNELFSNLLSKYFLFTGGMPCKYFNNLPKGGVDIVLIDTMHSNPGEHLNILEILPFLKKNAIVIYHDTTYHANNNVIGTTCCCSINTLNGIQLFPNSDHVLQNIRAVIIDDNIDNMLYPLFSNLSLPWQNIISKNDFIDLYKHYKNYYSQDLLQIFLFYYFFYYNGGLKNKDSSLVAEKLLRSFDIKNFNKE